MSKNKILVVDDSKYMRLVISKALSDAGFDVVAEGENGEQAIELAIKLKPDIIILDNMLPDYLGIEVLKEYSEQQVKAQVIIISGIGHTFMIKKALELGASDYIVKSTAEADLVKIVVSACQKLMLSAQAN